MQVDSVNQLTIPTSGTTNLSMLGGQSVFELIGSPAVNGAVVYQLDPAETPFLGCKFVFYYTASCTQGGGGTISIFSASANIAEAWWGKKLKIESFYDGSAWKTLVFINVSESGWIETTDIIDEAVTLAKIEDLTSAYLIVGNGSNRPTAVAMSGVIAITNAGVTSIVAGSIVNADINASAAIAFSKLASLTSANILVGSAGNVATSVAMSGDVTISNTGVTAIGTAKVTPAMLYGDGAKDSQGIAVSAESGEQANFPWIAPCNGTLTGIYTYVTKLVEATNDWTLTANIGAVPVTNGVVTIAANSPLNTADSATPTALNTFLAGDLITFTSLKVTAGGKAQLIFTYTRT